jgi:hypothetical protein
MQTTKAKTPVSQAEIDEFLKQHAHYWQAWAEKGWAVRPAGERDKVVAVNESTKMATEPAVLIWTLHNRLQRGGFNYWLYTKYAKKLTK